jgi:hypothetical protein
MKLAAASLACAALLASLAPAPAAAHGKAHVHGVMNLDIAIDGPVLAVMLRTPQDSLVGHERRPRNDAERQAAAAALALLRDAPRWFKPDAAAGCTAGPVKVLPGKLEGAAQPGEKDDGHADVEASVEWRCSTPSALRAVDLGLFEAFRRTERIEVQVAGGTGPAKQNLRRGQNRVPLAR